MHLIVSFLGSALALFLTANIVPGVSYSNLTALFFATIVLALVNTFIKPVLHLISLPITLLTLGLFALVINAITFALVAWIVPGFEVSGIIPTFIGALVLSIIITVIGYFTGAKAKLF